VGAKILRLRNTSPSSIVRAKNLVTPASKGGLLMKRKGTNREKNDLRRRAVHIWGFIQARHL